MFDTVGLFHDAWLIDSDGLSALNGLFWSSWVTPPFLITRADRVV